MPNASNFSAFMTMDDFSLADPGSWFRTHGLPVPPSFPTPTEVELEARDRSKKIFSHYDTLRQILDRHEDTIRKRWLKKTKKQQRSILLTVWPSMAPSHRPDFEALKREEAEDRAAGTKFRDWYLWPSINLQDLTVKKSLLHFINSRGRNPPSHFARSDFNNTGLAHASGALTMPFLAEHTMILNSSNVNAYGSLLSWADYDEAKEMSRSRRAFDPGQGLLALEIQQRIMQFLVKCCENILHDLSESGSLIGSQFPIKETLPPITTDASDYPTTIAIAIERQYRVPGHLNFQRLRALVAAKRSEAEDHIWALREDPGYFADTIIEWSEHRRERLLDTNGEDHPVGPSKSQLHDLFWERVIAHTIANAYGALINWNILHRQLNHLELLKEKYSGAISPTKGLPYEYLQALLMFRQMLTEAQSRPMFNLGSGAPASPPLRQLYVREPQDPTVTVITVKRKSGDIDELLFILELLWDPIKTHQFGLSDLLDQMEHMVEKDPQQKERLSTWVSDIISDLGLLAQARDELDSYHPWAAGMDYEFSKVHDKIERDVFEQFNARQLVDNNMKFVSTTLASLGSPVDLDFGGRRFYYPSDKRRTKEITAAMRAAEQNLDKFWARFDSRYKSKVGKTINEVVLGSLFEDRQLQRTAEWVEPLKEPKSKKKIPDTVEGFQNSFSALGLSSTGESAPSKGLPKPKAKIKTKGAAISDADAAGPEPPAQEDLQPTISVDRRAHKVFTTLFFTPNQSDLPGEIPWADFLHALASTGFRPEKLYGSVWQFTPTMLDVERSIHFHEPHPHSKIPFRIARRIGRRLNRAYGWHSGLFVLE